MTRVKKTRSLKRVHDVKTGSKSKLKKELFSNSQGTKRVAGRRVLSTYEKFLQENPEANAAAVATQKQQEQAALKQKEKAAKPVAAEKEVKERIEKPKTLLEQLDDSKLNLKDIY